MGLWIVVGLLVVLGALRLLLSMDIVVYRGWLPRWMRNLDKEAVKEWIDSALIAGAVALAVVVLIGRLYIIPTSSMEPNLKPGDVVLGLNYWWYRGKLRRGDIVIFYPPASATGGRRTLYIKRVLGLPGDVIELRDGMVFINGKLFQEPFAVIRDDSNWGPYRVPQDMFVVIGDNRPVSFDSRMWPEPFIPIENIRAKAVLLVFSLRVTRLQVAGVKLIPMPLPRPDRLFKPLANPVTNP